MSITDILIFVILQNMRKITNLDNIDIEITGVVVSEISENKRYFMGHRISSIDCFSERKDDILVLIAVSAKYKNGVIDNLKSKGFNNYIDVC